MGNELICDINLSAIIDKYTNVKLPEPELLEYYTRLENREILWNSDIDESFVTIQQQILDWNKEDKGKPVEERVKIKIFINTDGGCLNSVNHIINLIELSKTPVMTIGMGKCFSSGALLLMAGHKGIRYVFKTTEALIHDGATGTFGTVGKVLDSLEYTKETESKVKEYVLSHSDISEELYDKNYRRDWFLDSNKLIEYGIADKIITDLDEIL